MRRVPAVTAALLGILLITVATAGAAPGDLDPTFSGDGKQTTNFTARSDFAIDVTLQADGKIVAAGLSGLRGADPRFALTRYTVEGLLDSTFSGDGKVTTNFNASRLDAANDVLIQPDGKILASGIACSHDSDCQMGMARYNEDGTLDTSFGGGDGKVTFDLTGESDSFQGAAVLPDGRIVAGGIAGSGGNARFALVRFNGDGTLDDSFGDEGAVMTNFTPGFDGAWDMARQPDGKLVLGGSAGGSGGRFALARYNEDGSLDTSFSGDGKATADFTPRLDEGIGIVLLPGGQIVLAGAARFDTANAMFALAQFTSDGNLDSSFGGGDGKVTTSFTDRWEYASDVRIQSDGKIVAVGEASFSRSNSRFALARYASDGSLDTSFGGGDGKVTTNFTSGFDSAVGVEIQTDDKIVAAGGARFGGDTTFALARYEGVSISASAARPGTGDLGPYDPQDSRGAGPGSTPHRGQVMRTGYY